MYSAFEANNPEHVYINMSGAAGAFKTDLSTHPVATFTEPRNQMIVQDTQLYKLAVVRCDVTGARTLPLFIPSIQTGQPDPFLTNYQISVQTNQVKPSPTPICHIGYTYTLNVRFIGGLWSGVVVDTTGGLGTIAANVESALNVSFAPGFTVTQSTPYGNLVVTHTSRAFQLTVNATPTSAPIAESASAFGFLYQPTTATYQSLSLASTVGGDGITCIIAFPNPPFYGVPIYSDAQTISTNIEWEPQTQGLPPPASPISGQQSNLAYWTYDYQWFVTLFNKALAKAFASSILSFDDLLSSATPFLSYNSSTKLFSIYADPLSTPWKDNPISDPSSGLVQGSWISIAFNEMLSNLLMLPCSFDLYANAYLNFQTASLTIPGFKQQGVNSWVTLTNDFSPVGSLWSPVESIVFTAHRWNSRSELTSPTSAIGQDTLGLGLTQTTSYDSSQILTDVVPFQTDAADWRCQTTLYSPTQYRWIDLGACSPSGLMTVDFGIAWKNRLTGEVLPLQLNPLASFSAKVMLKRKDVLDN